MNTRNYSSIPQVPGPGGWEKPDREVDIARIIKTAETQRLSRWLLAGLAAIVLIALAWAFRWEITPITNGEGMGSAYMLNRWTGSMYYVRIDERVEVTSAR